MDIVLRIFEGAGYAVIGIQLFMVTAISLRSGIGGLLRYSLFMFGLFAVEVLVFSAAGYALYSDGPTWPYVVLLFVNAGAANQLEGVLEKLGIT